MQSHARSTRSPFRFAPAVLLLSAATAFTARAQDAHTLLFLRFEGSLAGEQGQVPVQSSGVTYEAGAVGQGGYFAVPNLVRFAAANNLNAREGTLEFWLKPRWSGGDGQGYAVLSWGGGGGMLFVKDGANNLRAIFNRYSVGGQPEIGVARNIGGWSANQWHHVAYTWSDSAKSLRMYIDGSLASQTSFTSTLPLVPDSTFQIGGDGAGSYVNAVVDELSISDVPRSADEIAADYMAGLTINSITLSPSPMVMYPTWRRSPQLDADTSQGPMQNLPPNAASWNVSNPSVARVEQGVIVALSPGVASVTATLNGKSASVALTVKAPARPPTEETPDPFLTTPAADALYEMPVAVIRYVPTLDGVNVDGATADWYGPVSGLMAAIDRYDIESKFMLEEGSRFRGFKDASAKHALGYRIVKLITVYEPMPPDYNPAHGTGAAGIYFPDYYQIMQRFDGARLVNELGVKEVWLWGYHHGNIAPVESDMSSPTTGDISNSNRFPDDLPVYNQTYVLYNYNFTRSSNESVHDHGHQLESILSYANQRQDGNSDLFWKKLTGRNAANQAITGRCGNTHMPPNTTVDYDYWNTTLVSSDIADWTPDNSGAKAAVNCNTWANVPYAWPYGRVPGDLQQHHWYIYWMQAMPGRGNMIPYGAAKMTDWWVYTAEWDAAIKATSTAQGLYSSLNTVPPEITLQPSDRTVAAGATLSLTVSATGSGALTYQWRRNGAELQDAGRVSGTGSDTLVVSAFEAADAGRYDALVRDGAGLSVSRSVRVSLAPTLQDAVTALATAAGLRTATAPDAASWDVLPPPGIDLPDASLLLRRALGL